MTAVLLALTGGVLAALVPEPLERVPIQRLLDRPEGRRLVVVEGTVREVSPNRFLLSDRTGELRVTTCPEWYYPLQFGKREKVRVVGHLAPRITWRNNNPVFLAYRMSGEYGRTVILRYNDGVPYWHRYRTVPGRRHQWEAWREMASASWPR